ncbi:unnamed protein product [Ilex paraguariensis]|uniref:PsbP C-terminal domain-containing protein n=1 Tax=Ilex paraguariensis TaxID=185542 RepID=A0ABC8RF78_9AQUA
MVYCVAVLFVLKNHKFQLTTFCTFCQHKKELGANSYFSLFCMDKLIQAERRKESTKDAEVIAVSERSGPGGLQVYEFEYEVDSTRGGMKRVFSAAFVASKKLYLLNIAHSDKPESPLNTEKRMILEEVLHSFDVVPLT